MLRWTLDALLVLAATPSQALVRLDSSFAVFDVASQGSDEFEPGPGTSGRSFHISDIGGCEGADETGERCGAYESSGFSLTLGDGSFAYVASLRQDQALVGPSLSTGAYVLATFRADREMRFRPTELRSFNVPLCDSSCTRSFSSGLWQEQEADGSWLAFVEVGTSAATSEGIQQVGHSFSVTMAEVPEPGAWAMLIAGFGLVGAVMRRRRVHPA